MERCEDHDQVSWASCMATVRQEHVRHSNGLSDWRPGFISPVRANAVVSLSDLVVAMAMRARPGSRVDGQSVVPLVRSISREISSRSYKIDLGHAAAAAADRIRRGPQRTLPISLHV